jgi:hypothetical protein
MIEQFPLCWPLGYPRTLPSHRISSTFKQSMERSQQFLRAEIQRLGAHSLVISTNIRVRGDGGLYSADLARRIDDPGVAIYFTYKKQQISMCCDQYHRIWENLYALGKGIEAIRGIERWGISDFLNKAFAGFTALPETSSFNQKSIYEILGLNHRPESVEIVRRAYRDKVKIVHPDAEGGSAAAFSEVNKAYKEILSTYNSNQ